MADLRQPISDAFAVSADLVFIQAFAYEHLPLPGPQGSTVDVLAFCRVARVPAPEGYMCLRGGVVHGVEVVAYPSDEVGRVQNWERRYHAWGVDASQALNSLRYQVANGVAHMENLEGILEILEVDRSATPLDWARMGDMPGSEL